MRAVLDSFPGSKVCSCSGQLTNFADMGNRPEARCECLNLFKEMYVTTHCVSFVGLPDNNSWFYNAFIVNKSSAYILSVGEFTELDVAPKFINLIFDVGI